MKFDKPFLSFPNQIDYLIEDKRLNVPNYENGINLLTTLSYYDLINGYKESFLDNEDKFDGSVTIEFLANLLYFDRSFQNSLFLHSVYIETGFKTALSHVMAIR